MPACGLPDAEQQPDERRLAGGARADDARGFRRRAIGRLTSLMTAGRCGRRTRSRCARRRCDRPASAARAAHAVASGARALVEPPPRAARVDQRFPAADQRFDRLQRAADQDRRGDHDAGRGLRVDDEPRADGEHHDLQTPAAACARVRSVRDGRRAETLLRGQQLRRVCAASAATAAPRHAHADDRLGIARERLGMAARGARAAHGTLRVPRVRRSVSTPSATEHQRAQRRRAAPSTGCISAMTMR